MNTANSIYEEVKSLPEPLAQEILDFVTFIKEKRLSNSDIDLMKAQAPVMESIWNNESDEVWNNA